MIHFKKYILLLFFMGSWFNGFCQKNVTKTNLLPGPLFNMYHVIQERALSTRLSMQTTVKARPASGFKGRTAAALEFDGVEYNPFSASKLSAIGNITELRIYGKKKEALRGFYWGPYFSYTHYKLASATFPGTFTDDNNVVYYADVQQVVKINVLGGGLQIGAQWLIKDLVAIDWTILGLGVSSLGLKGSIEATNTSGNFDFRNYDEDVEGMTFGLETILPIEKEVEKESVSLGVKAPWLLLKSGISIGIAYK